MRLGPLKGCHRVGRGRGGGGGKDKKNAKGKKREKREEQVAQGQYVVSSLYQNDNKQ